MIFEWNYECMMFFKLCFHWRTFLSGCFHIMGAMFFGGLQVGGLVAMCESHVRECNNSPARISLNHIDNIHNVKHLWKHLEAWTAKVKHLHSFCVWLAISSCNFSALFSRLSCLHVVQEKIKQLVPEICISVRVVVSHDYIITVATSRKRFFLRCFVFFS